MKRYFPTTPFDWFNYSSQSVNSNALIQFVLKLDSQLDFGTLQNALRIGFVAEPVLKSVFDCHGQTPRWAETDVDVNQLCRHIETADCQSAADNFLAEPIDASTEIPVKVAYVSNSCRGEYFLIVKIHHALCDGMAALQTVRLLAEMYGALQADRNFVPLERPLKRDTADLYRYFGVDDMQKRFDASLLPDMQSTWGTPIGDNAVGQKFSYRILRFDSAALDRMVGFAKSNGSSLNALITAAYHKALVQLLAPSQPTKELQFTVNLRPFSTDSSNYSLCNISSTLNVQLPTESDFISLVRTAKQAIDKVIEPERVLQAVLACELMSTSFEDLNQFYVDDWNNIKNNGLCTPMISNLGRLDVVPINFGMSAVADMYVVSPAFVGPSFMLSVSTYGNVMTLCAAYSKPSTTDEWVESLLHAVGEILTL